MDCSTGVYYRLLEGADGRLARWDIDGPLPGGWSPTGVAGDAGTLHRLVATAGPGARPRPGRTATGRSLLDDIDDVAAVADPDRPAVRAGADVLGYAELLAATREVAGRMTGHGLGGETAVRLTAGDRVAAVVGRLAAWRVGAVPVPPGAWSGRPVHVQRSGTRWSLRAAPSDQGARGPGPQAGRHAAALVHAPGDELVVLEHDQLRAVLHALGPPVAHGTRVVSPSAAGSWPHLLAVLVALTAGAELDVGAEQAGPGGVLVADGPVVRAGDPGVHTVLGVGRLPGAVRRVLDGRGTRVVELYPPAAGGVLPLIADRTPGCWTAAGPAYVLDERLAPVPAGHTGELYVGGPTVARGVAGRPDRTLARFLPDPFAADGTRMVATGCRARGPSGTGPHPRVELL